MDQQDFENVFIAKLSGIAEYKNKNEMWYENNENKVTIEFLNDSISIVKVRKYYENGNKKWVENYLNGKRHGKFISWPKNGNKRWEYDYQNGRMTKVLLRKNK